MDEKGESVMGGLPKKEAKRKYPKHIPKNGESMMSEVDVEQNG